MRRRDTNNTRRRRAEQLLRRAQAAEAHFELAASELRRMIAALAAEVLR